MKPEFNSPPIEAVSRKLALFIVASIGINLLLACLLWLPRSSAPSPISGVPQRPLRLGTGLMGDSPAPTAAAGPNAHSTSSDPWSALAQGDYREAIHLLRAAHCPEETIQDLIALTLSRKHLDQVLDASNARALQQAWWKAPPADVARDQRRERKDAEAALRREFESLLGVPLNTAISEFLPWRVSVDPDPIQPGHREAYDALLRQHREAIDAVSAKGLFGSVLLADQQAEVNRIESVHRRALQGLLSPSELEALQARQSPEATAVKDHFPEATSEEQFRQFVRLLKEHGYDAAALPRPGESSQQQGARLEQFFEQVRTRARDVVGESAWSELVEREQQRLDAQNRLEAERAMETLRTQVHLDGLKAGLDDTALRGFLDRVTAELRALQGAAASGDSEGSMTLRMNEAVARIRTDAEARFQGRATDLLRSLPVDSSIQKAP